MKLDMHCHVKEGSVDSRVSLDEYIILLKAHGFDGMVITDHDTYNAYRYWKTEMKDKVHTDFVVLKGIEYDTRDAGHILVIMPEGVKMRLLELKGMPVAVLIDLVHRNGGVLGPAHPYGEKYMSITNAKRFQKNPEIMQRFDFVEGFNACESAKSNQEARRLADQYGKICVGGSDSHKQDCVGLGYTVIPRDVTCETELIDLIHSHEEFEVGGKLYNKTLKDKIGKVNKLLVYGFWFYNRGGGILKQRLRNRNMEPENPTDPIDPIELYYMEQQERPKRYRRQ
ncbi:MAG: PHP domain-containing protein [Hespellia sp.]|nr:PHP domain-containing protein [Hespellia sp.]